MALNFPSNPSDNDVYEGYRWNATVGAWQSIRTGSLVTVSATEPANPVEGQLWFNENDSNMYIAYDSGSGVDWITPNAGIINTDADSGRMIYVGATDPDTSYTLNTGDVWIEVPSGS